MPFKNVVLAAATLIGTIVGAGVFGLPLVMAKSGLLICLFYFLLLGGVVLCLHLLMGEIVLRTKGRHRLIGYTKKYLGKRAQFFVAFSIIVGTIGALLAYIILGGKFLSIIFPAVLSEVQFALILWAVLSFFVLWGIRSIARVEFFMNIGFLAVISLIFFWAVPKIETANFVLANSQYIFLPFGVILFSLLGWSAVPEIERLLAKKKNLKKVIIWSMAIVLVFYFLFALVISGVSGSLTSPEAFEGLVAFLGRKIMILGGLFGILSIATSFLVLANHLKNSLIFDLGFPYASAFLVACLLPLLLYLLGFREFIKVIGSVGMLVGLIEGLLIVMIYRKLASSSKKV